MSFWNMVGKALENFGYGYQAGEDAQYMLSAPSDQEALVRLEGLMYRTYKFDDKAWEALEFVFNSNLFNPRARMLLGHGRRIRAEF